MCCWSRKSFHSFFNDQPMYLAFFIFRPHNCHLRKRRIADPHFCTIQYYIIPCIPEIRKHAAWITSMIGLCESKTAKPFTTCEFRKELFTLLFTSILIDREHYE